MALRFVTWRVMKLVYHNSGMIFVTFLGYFCPKIHVLRGCFASVMCAFSVF